MPSRWVRHAAWIVPSVVCVAVFWPGLLVWFQRDDFAWLGLRLEIYHASDLWQALFAPKAQGTIRPWSERGFFMLYSKIFGLEALPYRITVFVTQIFALFLLSRLTLRLTGCILAAFLAPLLWGVNAALGTSLSWTSAYNQIMCAAFLLGALLLWIRYADTAERKYYLAQFAVFLIGFGALEINIIYPGLVIAWCVLAQRWKQLPAAIPMALVSVAYFLYHNAVAPTATSGPYALHADASMLSTLGYYWKNAFGGRPLSNLMLPAWFIQLGQQAPWPLTIGFLVAVIAAIRARRWMALFGFAWFLGALVPVLPLRDHISDYYLTIPTIGIAIAAADALSRLWMWRPWAGATALAITVFLYAVPSGWAGRGIAIYNRDRSTDAEKLVFGVQRARELHPNQAILLTDVSTELFWSAMNDKPFRLLGLDNVFLAPGAENGIQDYPALGDLKSFLFPEGQVVQLLNGNQAVVYSAAEGRLRNITRTYKEIAPSRWKPGLPHRVDAGNPLFAQCFFDGWYPAEGGNRWMGKRGVLELRGPDKAGESLSLQGYLSKAVLGGRPMNLTVHVDEHTFPPLTLDQPDSELLHDFPLPDSLTGREKVRIVLEVDRAFVPEGETRELSILFGSIGIH